MLLAVFCSNLRPRAPHSHRSTMYRDVGTARKNTKAKLTANEPSHSSQTNWIKLAWLLREELNIPWPAPGSFADGLRLKRRLSLPTYNSINMTCVAVCSKMLSPTFKCFLLAVECSDARTPSSCHQQPSSSSKFAEPSVQMASCARNIRLSRVGMLSSS